MAVLGMTVFTAVVSAVPGASYCRFSSRAQDERTIADQQRVCNDRARRDGDFLVPLSEYVDEAISGAKHSRKGLDEMLAAARAGLFKVLYVVNLSRLARDCVYSMQMLRELAYVHEVRVVSIDEGIDTAQNESWELITAILGVQHEQYLKKLSKDVRRGQAVPMSGFWRFWCEHGGDERQVMGAPLSPFTTTNPDHIFEIHPVTKLNGRSLLGSLRPISGYEPKDAEDAFTVISKRIGNYARWSIVRDELHLSPLLLRQRQNAKQSDHNCWFAPV